jgi:hypothetical protein
MLNVSSLQKYSSVYFGPIGVLSNGLNHEIPLSSRFIIFLMEFVYGQYTKESTSFIPSIPKSPGFHFIGAGKKCHISFLAFVCRADFKRHSFNDIVLRH